MFRKLRFSVAVSAVLAFWAFGVVRFAAGSQFLGGAVIVVAGLAIGLLIGIYRNGRQGVAEGFAGFFENSPWS